MKAEVSPHAWIESEVSIVVYVSMKIMIRNSRGAASKSFAAALRNFKSKYKLDVVVILEPRISGNVVERVIKSWGFVNLFGWKQRASQVEYGFCGWMEKLGLMYYEKMSSLFAVNK